jgi:ferric-dicitrate binding protein FerR (iron transport regulator)
MLTATIDLTGDTTSIILEAGMAGVIDRSTGTISTISTIDQNKLFWKTNRYVFHEFRLADVFVILEEQFDVQLKVENPELENCLLTATFVNNDIDYILNIIAGSFELELKKENNTYTFEGFSCE